MPKGCIHHWVIEGYGASAPATCKKCGAETVFENNLKPDYPKTGPPAYRPRSPTTITPEQVA